MLKEEVLTDRLRQEQTIETEKDYENPLTRRFREFTPEDVVKLQEGDVPYNYLLETQTETFQELEKEDSAQIGLDGYRGRDAEFIKKNINNAQENQKIFVINGFSGSFKTEGIIKGNNSPIGIEFSLCGDNRFGFCDLQGLTSKSTEIIWQFEGKKAEELINNQQKEIIIFEEFYPKAEGEVQFIQELIDKYPNIKVVLTIGGRWSNIKKRIDFDNIDKSIFKAFENSAQFEVSVKPLNSKQVQEWLEKYIKYRKQNAYLEFLPEHEENLRCNWPFVLELSSKYPFVPRFLDYLSSEVSYKKFNNMQEIEKKIALNELNGINRHILPLDMAKYYAEEYLEKI